FFSSRRRHTRSKRDWSSDVCSSDLAFVATDQSFECRPTLEWNERERQHECPEYALHVTGRRLFEDQAAEVHQRERENVREQERPSEERRPAGNVGLEDDFRDEPAQRADDEQPGLQVIGRVVQELELFDWRDER